MSKPELVNAVGGGDLGKEIHLQLLHDTVNGEIVRYDPEHWPGLYLRFTDESPAVMVFRTGKYNIAGADSVQELLETNEIFLNQLQDIGISSENPDFEIRNLVFLDRYDQELELSQIVIALGLENAEYEPEQFPGVLFRPPNTLGTFLIFRNGKVILTGAKSEDGAAEAFIELFDRFDELFN